MKRSLIAGVTLALAAIMALSLPAAGLAAASPPAGLIQSGFIPATELQSLVLTPPSRPAFNRALGGIGGGSYSGSDTGSSSSGSSGSSSSSSSSGGLGGTSSGSSSSGSASSSNGKIDTSRASDGFFTVNYSDGTNTKMRVGLKFGSESTDYLSYKQGETTQYSFSSGSGNYTITLMKNTGGSNYSTVLSVTVKVSINQKYAQYLKSVSEISFKSGDSVVKKAESLCDGKSSDQKKILAIYNYIAKNFKYNYDFANDVRSGKIKTYTPKPVSILSAKKGVCYDFSSLFAAMCRSQGIPCKLVKGYSTKVTGYHAWNSVYDSATDKWYTIDLTLAVCSKNKTASKFSKCTVSTSNYTVSKTV